MSYFRIGPSEAGLSPRVGSTRKSQTDWLMSEGGQYLDQCVFADGQGLFRREFEPVFPGQNFNLGGDHVFALGDGAVGAHMDRADDAESPALIHMNDGESRRGRMRSMLAVGDFLRAAGLYGHGMGGHGLGVAG